MSQSLPAPVNSNYKIRNLVCFNLTGFFLISFMIFLTSSQPFYLHQMLKLGDNKVGKIVGTLGIIDEITSIITSPLIGSLNDRINNFQLLINGSKIIVFLSFIMITISFLIYGILDVENYYQLIIPRIVFSIGVTSGLSMIPVLLNQLIYSDFKFSQILFWQRQRLRLDDTQDNQPPEHHHDNLQEEIGTEQGEIVQSTPSNLQKNGRFLSMIGITTGLGAVFSVSFFLPLPIRLSNDYNLTAKDGLRFSFIILACFSIALAIIMLGFLYNTTTSQISSRINYFSLLKTGWAKSKDRGIRFAWVGGFIARSTSVLIAVFIPLFVYNFYYRSGICDSGGSPSKTNCYDGYIFSAILTGVAQTVGLLSSPFWGVCADKFGKIRCLGFSSVLGLLGNWLIVLLQLYDPRNPLTFILVSIIGVSQIGTIITSMSLISLENDVIGSVSGLYNLFGGLGILLLNQFGGIWSDYWTLAPFFLMGSFNLVLICCIFLL